MPNSKKDFCVLSKLILDFISSLTETEYNNLINGYATIKYTSKDISYQVKELYEDILNRLVIALDKGNINQDFDDIEELQTKSKKAEFCQYINISIKSKDTNEEIKGKIIDYVKNNKDNIVYKLNRKESESITLEEIAKRLEEFMDEKEAKEFLLAQPALQNKGGLIKLASKLAVYIEKDKGGEEIIEDIISSVVGAKIRSYKIRKKI